MPRNVVTEYFIRGSDNILRLTLLEASSPLAGQWSQVEIRFGNVVITRTSQINGITFDAGVLSIQPAALTEDVSGLIDGVLYPVQIEVQSGTSVGGSHWGLIDSDDELMFQIATAA